MFQAKTSVSFDGVQILINGKPTYAGVEGIEGLLFNVRTVNATFDDTLGEVDWWDDDGSYAQNDHAGYGKWKSPESGLANTRRYIEGLGEYAACGVLGVNLSFQGGHPIIGGAKGVAEGQGSAGRRPNAHRDFYHNSGFLPDGSIDRDHAARLSAIIEACDSLGMVVILEFFYFGQDTVFPDEQAVKAAVDSGVDYVCAAGYKNVIIEIANEVMHGHYKHEILKPPRVAELIVRARERASSQHGRRVLVSTSEAAMTSERQWSHDEIDAVFSVGDLAIIHGGDNVETGKVGDASELADKVDFIRSRPWYRERPRPILTNESHGEQALAAMTRRGVSFGLMSRTFQTMWPPKWGVWDNPTMWFFKKVKGLTGRLSNQE